MTKFIQLKLKKDKKNSIKELQEYTIDNYQLIPYTVK